MTGSGPMRRADVSIDVVVLGGLVVAAALLRLVDLGWMPLDPGEGARALPAWRAAHGLPVDRLPDAPLLFHLQRWVFAFGPGGDAAARLVPALAGVALVGVAGLLRPALGGPAALAAAAGFALDPLWLFAGRQASPATLAALGIVATLGLWLKGGRLARRGAPIAAALTLAAGGLAVTAAVAAAAVWGLRRIAGGGALARGGADGEAGRDGWRAGVAVFALAFGLATTGLFTRPDGLGAWLEGATAWSRPWTAGGDAWHGFVLPLAVYAPLLAVFGGVGIVRAPRRAGGVGLFVLIWAILALAMGVVAGSPDRLADAAMPLTLGAALALADLAAALRRGFRWGDDGVTAAILFLAAGYAWAYATAFSGATTPEDGAGLWRRAWLAAVLAGALAFVYLVVWGRALAVRVVGLTAVVVLGGMGWVNGSRVSYAAGLDVRELLRPAYVAPPAEWLARDLAGASRAATGDAFGMPTVVDPTLAPVLAWPLRERTALAWATAPAAEGDAAVLAVAAAPSPFGAGEPRTYAVSAHWTPAFAGRLGFLRWYLQRRPAVAANPAADGPVFQRAVWEVVPAATGP